MTSYFIPGSLISQNKNYQCVLPTPERPYLIYLEKVKIFAKC